MELLSTNYYSQEQKTEIENQIDAFTKGILKNSLFVDKSNFQNLFPRKKKLIKENLISEISVISKISYMLNKQGLLTEKTQNFVSTLVNDRNSVAHGKQIYQEKIVFPVPPFFPLIKNRFYSFEDLRILTGRAISCFVEIEYLREEWNKIAESLEPSIEQIREFLRDKNYENLSNDNFFSGVENGVTPFSITNYLLNKKLKPADALLGSVDISN